MPVRRGLNPNAQLHFPGSDADTFDVSNLGADAQAYLQRYVQAEHPEPGVDNAQDADAQGPKVQTRHVETPAEKRERKNKPAATPKLPQETATPGITRAQQERVARAAAVRQARRDRFWAQQGARAAGVVVRTRAYLGQVPQPGGIGLILFIILFILFAIQPMNAEGDTRISLLWLGLWGKVKLPTSSSLDVSVGASSPGGGLQNKVEAAAGGLGGILSNIGKTLSAAEGDTSATSGIAAAAGQDIQGIQAIQGIGIGIVSGLGATIPYSAGG